jgi:signal transduction histidine kinase
MDSITNPPPSPLSPEILVPRFGDYLLETGIITQPDMQRAADFQAQLRQKGENRLFGQVLVDMGIIDISTRDTAVTEMILNYREALQEANQQLEISNQQLERRVEERTAELKRALAQLAELNQLKANIVANISHELRTPLTHLKGYLELLLAGDLGAVNEAQQSALTVMERSTDRLGRLIEDLILFSVSERDQIHLQVMPFELSALCVTSIHKSGQKARERNIKLALECQPDLPQVEGDEEKVAWVIMQFLDNAIKFTPPGGQIKLMVWQDENYVKVAVADSGIGIPPERIDQVFESFVQLDGSTTRRAGGTGLGLALAKKLIEAHGSNIRVTSKEGQGSSFEFFLKVHPQDRERV